MKYNTLSIVGISAGILLIVASVLKYWVIYYNPSLCLSYSLTGFSFIVLGILYQHNINRTKEIIDLENNITAYGDKIQDLDLEIKEIKRNEKE